MLWSQYLFMPTAFEGKIHVKPLIFYFKKDFYSMLFSIWSRTFKWGAYICGESSVSISSMWSDHKTNPLWAWPNWYFKVIRPCPTLCPFDHSSKDNVWSWLFWVNINIQCYTLWVMCHFKCITPWTYFRLLEMCVNLVCALFIPVTLRSLPV